LNTIRIVDASSPLVNGITSAGLSGWASPASAYGYFSGSIGSFTGVADDGNTGEWTTLARPVGSGFLVYSDQPVGLRITTADSTLGSPEVNFLDNVVTIPEPHAAALCGAACLLWTALRCSRRRRP
jgi:hypothetical protein